MNEIARAARDQFLSSYRMLRTFAEICPDSVWESRFYGFEYPVWYQVYHVAFFVDYWLREDIRAAEYLCKKLDERIPPEFEHALPGDVFIPRAEMLAYMALLSEKLDRFFAALTDGMLARPVVEGRADFSYQDVILGQIRHVMYNVGYLNGILRGLGLPESDWYAINEDGE